MNLKGNIKNIKIFLKNERLSSKSEKGVQIKVLRLERLSYLLNNKEYIESMEQLLLKHIEFIQDIVAMSNQEKKYKITELWRKYPFINSTTQLRAIIKKLEENFDIKFNFLK